MIRETKFSTKIYLLKEPIRYAIPLIPTSVLEGVVESLDRLILEKFVGLNHLGIYTLAKQFGSAFNFINNMLKNSWLPLIYRVVCERKDGPQILSRLSLLYSTSMLIPALVIATLSSDFINFFALKKFDLASDLVPFMILAFYWQVLTVSYGRGLDLAKKTNMSFLIPTIAILTNCIVSYYFIPKWGLFGAVFAFNLTLLMKMVTQVSISSYYYPRPFQKLKILIKIGISLATYLLARQINSSNDILDILGKSILLLLSFSSLYFLIVKDSIRQLKPKKTMWLNRQKHQ